MESYFIGSGAIGWSFGDTIDRDLNRKVLYIYRTLKKSDYLKELGVLDIVPSFNAIAFYFDHLNSDPYKLKDTIESEILDLLKKYSLGTETSNIVTIPVTYNGEDLDRVAKLNSLSIQEVISLHQKPDYQVAMIGFKPYFPYLIGLDSRLETPRLDSPRVKIPAGSVAIGGGQTGVYPQESPGGWNIIGSTDPELLKTLKPGDILKFKGVVKSD